MSDLRELTADEVLAEISRHMVGHASVWSAVRKAFEDAERAEQRIEELERERDEARKALDFTEQAPGRIQEIMRSNGLVIDDLGDAHQKLAFTVYTELCECASQCEAARAAAKGGEDE